MARDLEHPLFRRDEGPLAKFLLFGLWLLSFAFRAIVRRRRKAWRSKATRVAAKVVSVGGLTVGGAGKTPIAIHLARRLAAEGRSPAVLSRGWGRDRPGQNVVVSDGKAVLADVRASGDEPMLVARSCPGVPVLVGPNRAAVAQIAIERFGARTLVLDDGFQHLGLARDLDVVVLDASNPFGNGHLLPRGPLREPKEALASAGLVWLSKVDQAAEREIARLEADVRRWTKAPIVKSGYRVVDVLDDTGASLGPRALVGKKVLMLAGLARPLSFAKTLEAMGATVAAHRLLPDHGWPRPMDVDQAKLAVREMGLDAIALTEKDAVRLPDSARRGPFAVVRVEVEVERVGDGEAELARVLQAL
ncbi:MAG TPA: tetraacyldisaccharide 4'-kinase [Myxococcales bacterium]|jgi:tetraacyldisaccharide 4'-kinase